MLRVWTCSDQEIATDAIADAGNLGEEPFEEGVQAGGQDFVDAAEGEFGFKAPGLAQVSVDWALATCRRLATMRVTQCESERGIWAAG